MLVARGRSECRAVSDPSLTAAITWRATGAVRLKSSSSVARADDGRFAGAVGAVCADSGSTGDWRSTAQFWP